MGEMRPAEFERLFDEHAQSVFAFLAYRTGDRTLAEDLLSDTFERALRASGRFQRRSRDRSWLYTIALNCLRDHARRRDAEERALVRAGPPADIGLAATDRLEARDAVARAMATLSAEEREAIALRFGAELTVPEIARVLKQPLTTVEGRVYRAMRKLRDEMS